MRRRSCVRRPVDVAAAQRRALVAGEDQSLGLGAAALGPWRQACTTGPADFLARIEAAEQSDPDGRRWARSKPSDDKTLAIVRFT